jgi:hypothetical protein
MIKDGMRNRGINVVVRLESELEILSMWWMMWGTAIATGRRAGVMQLVGLMMTWTHKKLRRIQSLAADVLHSKEHISVNSVNNQKLARSAGILYYHTALNN